MRLTASGLQLRLPGFALQIDLDCSFGALGIFGPSGAGKTTFLELIAGLRRAESGSIAMDGREITRLPSRARRIGYLPQDETLFPHMSVRRNIAYGAEGDGATTAALAEVLGIASLLDRGVARLSGGERRRVALARALASNPRAILLDEPLTGLDAALRRQTVDVLAEVMRQFELPLILVSHEREDVSALCDTVAVLDRGTIRIVGKPGEVL